MPPPDRQLPLGVMVTLPEIYKQVLETDDKVEQLTKSVGEMVAVNKRLDQHHARLNDHGSRINTLETSQAIQQAVAPRKAPWYSIVAGVVGIVTGLIALVALLNIAAEITGG